MLLVSPCQFQLIICYPVFMVYEFYTRMRCSKFPAILMMAAVVSAEVAEQSSNRVRRGQKSPRVEIDSQGIVREHTRKPRLENRYGDLMAREAANELDQVLEQKPATNATTNNSETGPSEKGTSKDDSKDSSESDDNTPKGSSELSWVISTYVCLNVLRIIRITNKQCFIMAMIMLSIFYNDDIYIDDFYIYDFLQ